MPHLYVINSQFTKEKHLFWYTKPYRDDGRYIILVEVVERTYPHPDAPEYANVEQIEEKEVASFLRASFEGGNSVLLEAAQNAISLQMKTFVPEK